MNRAEQVIAEIKRSGRVWLGGELEFPADSTPTQAFTLLNKIACECGHIVSIGGSSVIKVYPYNDPGYFVLDWFDPDGRRVKKVEYWSLVAAYLEG